MIVEKVKAMDGREVTFFTPENDEDIELLRKMAEEGQVDDAHSFADRPEAWERPKRKRRRNR